MKKNDFLLIICVLVLAGGVFLWNNWIGGQAGGKVVAYVDGETYATYDLHESASYVVDTKRGQNIFVVEDGKVKMKEADCPDGLCVKQGAISKTGETIVCLPNRVVIEIEGGQENDLDGVSG